MPRKPFPFLMGADPEFTIQLNGKRANAVNVFRHFKGKDAVEINGGIKSPSMKGNIGWDGCASTGEIRPDPANTADGLVENIKTLFEPILPNLPAFDFTVLSLQAPIGGHVHLDLPKNASDATISRLKRTLVSFYLPIMLSENPVSQAIRCRSYGKLGDCKTDNTFSQGNVRVRTLEFRTPSAEWLASPKVATAVLAFLGTVWNEAVNHPKNIAKWKDLSIKTDKQMELLQSIANSNFTAVTAMMLKQIQRAVRTFEFYPEYKSEIEWLFKPQLVLKEKASVNYDLAKGWGLRKNTAPNKKTFMSDAALKEANKDNGLSLDFIAKNMPMPYNGDVGVADFATALSARIAALGWKPKYNYYFFGLKKGTERILAGNKELKIALDGNEFATNDALEHAVSALNRMIARGVDAFSSHAVSQVDPKTGFISKPKKEVIAIGLPASIREKHNVKKALEAVWNIEEGLTEFKVPTVVAQKNAQPENVTLAADEETDFIDTGSQGIRMAEGAIQDLQNEHGINQVMPTIIDEDEINEWLTAIKKPENEIYFGGETWGWLVLRDYYPGKSVVLIDENANARGFSTFVMRPSEEQLVGQIPLGVTGLKRVDSDAYQRRQRPNPGGIIASVENF